MRSSQIGYCLSGPTSPAILVQMAHCYRRYLSWIANMSELGTDSNRSGWFGFGWDSVTASTLQQIANPQPNLESPVDAVLQPHPLNPQSLADP